MHIRLINARRAITLFLVISLVFVACTVSVLILRAERRDGFSSVFAGALAEKIIIIDAGHGGEDPGALAADGTMEKDLNLLMAKEIGSMLSEHGFQVLYTRTEDRLLYKEEENIKGLRKISDLKNRVAYANAYPGAILISVHMNAYQSASCKGLQVYYSENTEESEKIAEKIQSRVVADVQTGNRRQVKRGKDIYLLEHCEIPAVLIECGFISNPEECRKLSEKEYRNRLCFSIVCAMIEYEKTANAV